MKILVISLLRMGDVIMATPTLRGLRKRFPNARIDLLYNSQFVGLVPIIPHVDRFIPFQRDWIQRGLGDSERPLFEPYDRLKVLMQELQGENYDLVLNVTHNKLSGYIASLCSPKEVMGLSMDNRGRPRFGSNWFRHLNRYGLDREGAHFHYSDLFYFGSQLGSVPERYDLKESLRGIQFAEKVTGDEDYILIQAQTSDKKKNYPLESFAEGIRHFRLLEPTTKIFFLSTEDERATYQKLIKDHSLEQCEVVVCDLEQAYSLLKGSRLLITVDTGIKHIAAAAGCKIIEISIGSSHFRSTGVYGDGSLIVQSRVPCAPCPHSKPCHQSSQLCAEGIAPDLLGLIWAKYLEGDREGLRVLAREGFPEVALHVVSSHALGYWTTIPLYTESELEALVELVDQLSWKMLLEREHEKRMPQIGSFSQKLSAVLRNSGIDFVSDSAIDQMTGVERAIERFESRTDILLLDFQQVLKSKKLSESIMEFVNSLRRLTKELKGDLVLKSYGRTIERVLEDSGGDDFSVIRRLRECLVDTKNRIQIEHKILKTIKNQLAEGA